jgi:hypothetical protein
MQIALVEAQAAFDTVWLDFGQQQQPSPVYPRWSPLISQNQTSGK